MYVVFDKKKLDDCILIGLLPLQSHLGYRKSQWSENMTKYAPVHEFR